MNIRLVRLVHDVYFLSVYTPLFFLYLMIDKRKPSWWYMLNPLVRRKSNRSNRGITVDGTDCEGPIPTDEAGY